MDTESTVSAFQMIPLGSLVESKTNPRGNFDAEQLKEMTESVKSHGVLQTILVRRVGDKGSFEIVAGARRFRAAKAAKLESIPATVRELSDDQVLELQLVENLQRADVHPLDEANGYKALLKKGHEVADLAARVGKTASYIYQRVKLGELIPDAQTAFREDRISASHAVQIARLQPAEQNRALNRCFEIYREADKKARKNGTAKVSVRELAEFIADEMHLDLAKAPFPVADALLVKKAGACTVCPKRAGNNPGLFPDIKKADTCTDPGCYQAKMAAFIEQRVLEVSNQREAGDPLPLRVSERTSYSGGGHVPKGTLPENQYTRVDADSCESARQAVVTDGKLAGQEVTVCADPKCRTHHTREGYKKPKVDSASAAAERKKQAGIKQQKLIRSRILAGIVGAAPAKLPRADLCLLAMRVFTRSFDLREQKAVYERFGWKPSKASRGDYRDEEYGGSTFAAHAAKLKEKQFNALLLELALKRELSVDHWSNDWKQTPPMLAAVARRYKVNVAAIEKEIAGKTAKNPPKARLSERVKK